MIAIGNKIKDLLGFKYGNFTVIDRADDYIDKRGYKQARWKCLCDCGAAFITYGSIITGRKVTQCPECSKQQAGQRARKNLIGKKFGRLFVVASAPDHIDPKSGKKFPRWICHCECGNYIEVLGINLVQGGTRSCGCLLIETSSKINYIHGGTAGEGRYASGHKKSTKIYQAWRAMRLRCYNPNTKYYSHYGGRGIEVCDEWRNNFQAFEEWSLTHGHADNLSLDRIDVNGNYEPSNCRWATPVEQGNNKRTNKYFEFDGKKLTIAEWAREVGIGRDAMAYRLRKWPLEYAVTAPPGSKLKDYVA